MHHDDGPRFGVEVTQCLVQDVAVDDRGREVADHRIVDRRQFDLDRPVTATTQDIDAGVDDELAEPGVEPLGIAKPTQVTPGVEESVLDRVMSKVRISEDQSGRRVQPGDGRSSEHREGVMIAPLRLLDEVSLVHDSPRSQRPSVALTEYGGGVAPIVPLVVSAIPAARAEGPDGPPTGLGVEPRRRKRPAAGEEDYGATRCQAG